MIVLKLKEAETERTFIDYPSAKKNSSLLVKIRKRHCSTPSKKCSEMCHIYDILIIGFATLDLAHLGGK